VLLSGAALAAAGTAIGLKNWTTMKSPGPGCFPAPFHCLFGPCTFGTTSVHLIMNGIVGLLLGGWLSRYPGGLALQAVFFQFGGITSLGVNTSLWLCRRWPAIIFLHRCCAAARQPLLPGLRLRFMAVCLGGIIVGLALMFTEEKFFEWRRRSWRRIFR